MHPVRQLLQWGTGSRLGRRRRHRKDCRVHRKGWRGNPRNAHATLCRANVADRVC